MHLNLITFSGFWSKHANLICLKLLNEINMDKFYLWCSCFSESVLGGFSRVILVRGFGDFDLFVITLEAKSLQDLRSRLDRLEAQSGQSRQSGPERKEQFVDKCLNIQRYWKGLKKVHWCDWFFLSLVSLMSVRLRQHGQHAFQWCTCWTSKKQCPKETVEIVLVIPSKTIQIHPEYIGICCRPYQSNWSKAASRQQETLWCPN